MKKLSISLLLALFVSSLACYSQESVETLIRRGVYLHDKGDYQGAIAQYNKVLATNPASSKAMYELSISYLALEDYTHALKYSTMVINSNYKPLLKDSYNVKSAALAGLEKYSEAIVLLKDALTKFGDDYLLNYNLGLSYFKNHDMPNAILYLENSINEISSYPESYFVYGYALIDQGRWLEAFMSLNSFLLLLPDDERSKDVFEDMLDILQNRLTGEDSPSTGLKHVNWKRINQTLNKVKTAIPKYNTDNSYLFFQEGTKSILAELKLMQNDDAEGMFWDYFVPTFIDILDSGYYDTFCRYISVSAYPESLSWWKSNQTEVAQFTEWFESTNGDDPEMAEDEE